MFKLKKRYIPLLFLILLLSVPISGQDSTEETPNPTEAPTEVIVTELITEAPTEVATEAPVVTEVPTEEAVITEAPVITDAPVLTEVPTEETVVTEAPVITPEATETAVEVTPIPTETPATNIQAAPAGEAVEMLLRYDPNASAESIAEMLRSLGAVELERIPQIGAMRVLIPSSVSTVASAQTRLQSNSVASEAGLASLEPNHIWQVEFDPNDPLFQYQTDLEDFASDYSIFMNTAWDISPRDGQGVTVAVLDTGIDIHHPDLAGKFVAGWNFYDDSANFDDLDYDGTPPSGYDYQQGHGTHVSGTIAARTNNGIGIAGMAYNSMILPVKVCGYYGCPTYDIASGIIYAVDRGAKVINMSLGGYYPSTTVEAAVNYALSRNVVVVASAGNYDDDHLPFLQTDPAYPASYPGVINVGSVQSNGSIAPSSQTPTTGNTVTVAAPGVSIASTWPLDSTITSTGYLYNSGTSMAAPHVSALAAMLIADSIAITPAQVREALICSAKDDSTNPGYDTAFGYGLIQADRALSWDSNSLNCQVSIPNDYIEAAMTITSPNFTVTQAVNSRSVTESASDPQIAGNTANQTLWYKFTPTTSGEYMFSTLGSSGYDTLLGVYQGMPGALTQIASNDDTPIGAGASWLNVTLARSVTYYIQVGTLGTDVVNQFVRLNVNQGTMLNTLQQENAAFIRYTGSWNRVAQTGSSGGFVNTTSDDNATFSVLMRGSELAIQRLMGPSQGAMELYVDGVWEGTFSNLAAVTRLNTLNITLDPSNGGWHLIMIKMQDNTVAPISIDAVQVSNNPFTPLPTGIVGATRVSETVLTTFAYHNGPWTTVGLTTALNANARRSSGTGAYIEFRTSGTGFTFWRETGITNAGTMDIYIDNVLVTEFDDYNNAALDTRDSVPFSIANLPQRERVVRIERVGGVAFSFDGAQSINQTVLAPNVITDERSTALVYSGDWTRSSAATTVANAGTLSTITGNTDGNVQFMFNGNHLCIGYQSTVSTDTMDVYLDDNFLINIDTNGTGNKVEWCTYSPGSFNTIPDGTHSVRIEIPAGEEIHLDYIRPVRRTVLTSTMGYVTETNTAFRYTGNWITTTQASTGGSKFQGGSARRSDADDLSIDTVSFTMNGTGFILYTSLPAAANTSGWQVFVDGSITPLDIEYQAVTNPYIDLWGYWDRFRPVGYGVIELTPGVHNIQLLGVTIYGSVEVSTGVFVNVTNPLVDFDGVRILP